jgi:hypothetical protein
MHVTPTALLANREGQPIQDLTSFGTVLETHGYVQGYHTEHLMSASTVTHLFGDGDPDVDCLKMKASVAKEFAKTEKPHGNRESSQAQESQLKVIVMTEELELPQVETDTMALKTYKLTHTIAPG